MADFAALSVLLAEDSALQREAVLDMLSKLGLGRIAWAEDGEHALAQLSSQPVDVLMTDLAMPGMDGVELIRRVAEQRLARAIVILSGRGRGMLETVEAMAEQRGMRVLGALPKPVRKGALATILASFEQQSEVPPGPPRPERIVSLSAIAQAIERDELVLHYQPKVTALTGVLYGVEALVRWQHPQYGLLSPVHFVPLAEEGGLIDPLTDWVLESAMRQLCDWHARGLRINVAVNLSAKSLSQTDLADRIEARAAQAGVEPKYVVLEITETAITNDIALALGTLVRLRLKGFGLSIDDFGTGFSSLQQLARVPFSELKIDRSMVDGAAGHPPLHALLKSIIDLGRKLHLKTVAEGVETEADWQLLRLLGCDVVQGYYAAKPMPADQLPVWLKHGLDALRLRARQPK